MWKPVWKDINILKLKEIFLINLVSWLMGILNLVYCYLFLFVSLAVIQAIYIEMVFCKESMSVPFSSFPCRGIAWYKMKCRHNLRRGVWGPGGRFRPLTKTILSVNRCTYGEIWTIKDMKVYSYFIMETIQKSKSLIYFSEYENFWVNVSTPLFRIILSCKNSASQSIESIAKIIINAICMKETFTETLK